MLKLSIKPTVAPLTGRISPTARINVIGPSGNISGILFIEKEGFFDILVPIGWPEEHDCALMTSKGQPTKAARDLIDLISRTDEPVQVFCLHDCDAAGTKIFETLFHCLKRTK